MHNSRSGTQLIFAAAAVGCGGRDVSLRHMREMCAGISLTEKKRHARTRNPHTPSFLLRTCVPRHFSFLFPVRIMRACPPPLLQPQMWKWKYGDNWDPHATVSPTTGDQILKYRLLRSANLSFLLPPCVSASARRAFLTLLFPALPPRENGNCLFLLFLVSLFFFSQEGKETVREEDSLGTRKKRGTREKQEQKHSGEKTGSQIKVFFCQCPTISVGGTIFLYVKGGIFKKKKNKAFLDLEGRRAMQEKKDNGGALAKIIITLPCFLQG